ncbi:MAG: DUF6788 family protein [Acidimicrobiales bacterium]
MATKRTTTRLEGYERRYRALARQLADVGYIAAGSVALRYNRCGKESCGCHGDPPRLHGPYFQWTAKVNGKTVNRRLSPSEAALYGEWIGNDRQVRALLTQMRAVAAKAQQLMLEECPSETA